MRRGIERTRTDRDAAIDAMRIAAEKRVKRILAHSSRRHYAHASVLVALCVASAPAGRDREVSNGPQTYVNSTAVVTRSGRN